MGEIVRNPTPKFFLYEEGIPIPEVDRHLVEKKESPLPVKWNITHILTEDCLRIAAQERGGSYSTRGSGNYDTINVPYNNGTLIIERIEDTIRTSFFGNREVDPDKAIEFLDDLFESEREIHNHVFCGLNDRGYSHPSPF